MTVFEEIFGVVVGEEGGFTADPTDPGNWTGGMCGTGRCVGTKFGISAAAYPTLDIAGLDIAAAREIYRRDYWNRVRGDDLPPALALLVFDAAVNNGVDRAARWLQQALGVAADGQVGNITIGAVKSHAGQGAALLAEVQALRLAFMGGLPTWRRFGLGWSRRLCRLPFEAMRIGGAS